MVVVDTKFFHGSTYRATTSQETFVFVVCNIKFVLCLFGSIDFGRACFAGRARIDLVHPSVMLCVEFF